MSDYTYATLIVSAEQQELAKELLSQEYFNLGLSADGTAPATHFVTSGPFSNEELNTALNQSEVKFWVSFGISPDYNEMQVIAEEVQEALQVAQEVVEPTI